MRNKELLKANRRRYEENNKERVQALHRERARRYRAKNPDKVKAWRKIGRERNRARAVANTATYRAMQRNATPIWADRELIGLIYAEAQYRKMEVDHIIPICGKLVCGLHVHNNMQLLTKSQNSRKLNSFPVQES